MPRTSTPRARPLGLAAPAPLLSLCALTSVGCSVAAEEYTADVQSGSTQAVVAVSRAEGFEAEGVRAEALAGFVHLPAGVARSEALALAGLSLELPELGQCERPAGGPARPEQQISHIDFLDAGRVRLIAAESAPHELAPHAFPTVADLISGVLYASRDRSGEGLPAGTPYRLETHQGESVGALTAWSEAPTSPDDVTLGGLPLDAAETLLAGRPLDLTWAGSADPNNRVYVVLSSSAGRATWCSFEDAAGAGTVPTASYRDGDPALVEVHRVRVTHPAIEGAAPGVDALELRYDFSVSRPLTFVSAVE